MKAILSADKDWGIGYKGKLLLRIKEDMQYFREKTEGSVVVMGRKTFESLPWQKPLSNRINIVLTRSLSYKKEGIVVVHNVDELKHELRKYKKEVFVIGGEQIYRMLLDFCDTVYVTKINAYFDADAHFPNLDKMPEWEMIYITKPKFVDGIEYRFAEYKRKKIGKQNKTAQN